jgi:hypothetical protein
MTTFDEIIRGRKLSKDDIMQAKEGKAGEKLAKKLLGPSSNKDDIMQAKEGKLKQ